MKHHRRHATRTDNKRKTAPRKSTAAAPALAPAVGHVASATETTAGRPLWQNGEFAVTEAGLAIAPAMVCIIPNERLPDVGRIASSLSVEHSDHPFIEALDHALRIHHPAEFPNGLKMRREPEGG